MGKSDKGIMVRDALASLSNSLSFHNISSIYKGVRKSLYHTCKYFDIGREKFGRS